MKTVIAVCVPVLIVGAALYGQEPGANVNVNNQITSSQTSNVTATGTNSESYSEGGRSSVSVNAFSNVDARTPPLTTFPPYLPYWTHGGWGTIKAYFPNGPTPNDGVYETTFDPKSEQDMRELKNVLTALPHKGPLEVLGAMLNDIGSVFGGPDMYHHGRGFEIADSIVRDRRPERKPLLVFIDSNVDPQLLAEQGYAYVGKVSVEGDVERNWDHVYMAAVAEALPWDVDILLVAGGMKGVTVGSNLTFPSGAVGYSQPNYSLSLFGAAATGITEGKGKAVLSAEAYRLAPQMVERRRIPEALYDRIRARGVSLPPAETVPVPHPGEPAPAWQEPTGASLEPLDEQGQGAVPQTVPQGTGQGGQLLPPLDADQLTRAEPNQPGQMEFSLPVTLEPNQPGQSERPAPDVSPTCMPPGPLVAEPPCGTPPASTRRAAQAPSRPLAAQPPGGALQRDNAAGRQPALTRTRPPAARAVPPARTIAPPAPKTEPGIEISRELFNIAGFSDPHKIKYLTVR
jgi:hypothetical protein